MSRACVRALTRLLCRDGYRVGTASNGRHALAQLQAQPYDVIVCDLRMPELDGPAFYAILTRQYPALRQRVIFLTGDAGGEASRTFLTQCGRPWLRKPSPIDDDPPCHSAGAPSLSTRRGLARARSHGGSQGVGSRCFPLHAS